MSDINSKRNYGAFAFAPLLVFLVLYLGFGLYFYLNGENSPFSFVSRESALMFGIATALLMGGEKFASRVDDFIKGSTSPEITMTCFIFILAGNFLPSARPAGESRQ